MISAIRTQIESDKESYKSYTTVFNSIIEGLNKVLSDDKIDKEERRDITNKLVEIGKIMAEVEKNRIHESEKSKRFWPAISGICVLILAYMTGKRFLSK